MSGATRERFEQYFGYQDWSRETPNGEYFNRNAERRWEGWQAAMADMDELLGALRATIADPLDLPHIGIGGCCDSACARCKVEAVLARYGKS